MVHAWESVMNNGDFEGTTNLWQQIPDTLECILTKTTNGVRETFVVTVVFTPSMSDRACWCSSIVYFAIGVAVALMEFDSLVYRHI